MPAFCQLVNPEEYHASEWNIAADALDRDYWFGLFEGFPDYIEPLLRADTEQAGPDFETRWAEFVPEWRAGLAEVRATVSGSKPVRCDADTGSNRTGLTEPGSDRFGSDHRLMTIDLTRYRNRLLDRYGWPDPYRQVKARENALAVELYPGVVARIDATPAERRWEPLFRGVFAGNMFDLGSPKTIEMYQRGEIDFQTILANVPRRPWFVDDADALMQRLGPPARYRQAMVFVDNAGTDIVLGVLPLAREMARAGMRVVLAANDGPALNDIMIGELRPLLRRLAERDTVLSQLIERDRITAIGSGGDTPLIDLGRVSEECNAEAARSDLVVLEGMGRGVESNWDQRFECDVWRIALLKDESVVRYHRAKLFDAVCRFDPNASVR